MNIKELVQSALRVKFLRIWRTSIVGSSLTPGQKPGTIKIPGNAGPKNYILLGDDKALEGMKEYQGYF